MKNIPSFLKIYLFTFWGSALFYAYVAFSTQKVSAEWSIAKYVAHYFQGVVMLLGGYIFVSLCLIAVPRSISLRLFATPMLLLALFAGYVELTFVGPDGGWFLFGNMLFSWVWPFVVLVAAVIASGRTDPESHSTLSANNTIETDARKNGTRGSP